MKLGVVLKQHRQITGKQGKVLAAEIGIGASMLSRIEHGRLPDAAHLVKIMVWLLEEDPDGH